MDIMELGAIGELVGGGAVIATLVYLALQVRQNTSAVRTNSAQSWAQSMNELNLLIVGDGDVARIFGRHSRRTSACVLTGCA